MPSDVREEAEFIMDRLQVLVDMVDKPRTKALSDAGKLWAQAKLYVQRGLWRLEGKEGS